MVTNNLNPVRQSFTVKSERNKEESFFRSISKIFKYNICNEPKPVPKAWVLICFERGLLKLILQHLITSPDLYYKEGALMKNENYSSLVIGMMEGPFCLEKKYFRIHDMKTAEDKNDHLKSLGVLNHNLCVEEKIELKQLISYMYNSNNKELLFGKNSIALSRNNDLMFGYLGLLKQSISTCEKIVNIFWIPNSLFAHVEKHTLNPIKHKTSEEWDLEDIVSINIMKNEKSQLITVLFILDHGFLSPQMYFPKEELKNLILFLMIIDCELSPISHMYPTDWPGKIFDENVSHYTLQIENRGGGKLKPDILKRGLLTLIGRLKYSHETIQISSLQNILKSKCEKFNNQLQRNIQRKVVMKWYIFYRRKIKILDVCDKMKIDKNNSLIQDLRDLIKLNWYLEKLPEEENTFEKDPDESKVLINAYFGKLPIGLREKSWPILLSCSNLIDKKKAQKDYMRKLNFCRSLMIHIPEPNFLSEYYLPDGLDKQIHNEDIHDTDPAIRTQFLKHTSLIYKDVYRCDRHLQFFQNKQNLQALRNILLVYVLDNLHVGYIQGMTDLAAPLLYIMKTEANSYTCFKQLMCKMEPRFPHKNDMMLFNSLLCSLMEVCDYELWKRVGKNSEDNLYLFTYRWYLLNFKRELNYDEMLQIWEIIWAGERLITPYFSVFVAFTLISIYRELIIYNEMNIMEAARLLQENAEQHNLNRLITTLHQNIHIFLALAFL